MSLNIKNEETVRLVRELADELHVSLTELRDGTSKLAFDPDLMVAMWGELGDRLGKEYLSQDFDALLYDEKGLPK